MGVLVLLLLVSCYFDAFVEAEAPVEEAKTTSSYLSPVRPLPCHSVTMVKNFRPTEFLFIAPGNSGDCSFIFEGLEDGRLDIKVRNLKSNLPRGNGDACEDGQVRLYNYKGSGQVKLAQRLCDNEKEVSILTDSNMAIIASSIIDGSFSVVARSVRQDDLLANSDVDQFLKPPNSKGHDWNVDSSDEGQEDVENKNDDDIIVTEADDETSDNDNKKENENDKEEALEDVKEPSSMEVPPNEGEKFIPNYFVQSLNMTDSNSTKNNCSYNSYGYRVCNNGTKTNHTGYEHNHGYYYRPKPMYVPPYEHKPVYEAPKPVYKPPVYSSPKPTYTAPVYKPPEHNYAPPKPIYNPPDYMYSSPNSDYKPPEHIYFAPTSGYKPDHTYSEIYPPVDNEYYNEGYYHSSAHEKPFRPSQPIPNDFWEGYESHQNNRDSPIWYDDNAYGPYPGKPTKHVDLTHDSYPNYPSYYNPDYYGNYGKGNVSTTTPPSLTTNSTTKGSTTSIKESTKQITTTTTTTKKPTTKKHHIFGIPWTANISITSKDNLE